MTTARTPLPVMLARGYHENRVRDWSSTTIEPKLDGVRVTAKLDARKRGFARFYTRNGRELTMFPSLRDPLLASVTKLLSKYTLLMVDTELLVGNTFNATGGAIHRKDASVDDARLAVFFAMPWEQFKRGADTLTQANRMEQLDTHFRAQDQLVERVPYRFIDDPGVLSDAADEFMEQGYEGAMVKQVWTPYGARRSYDWMKIKGEETVDLKVHGLQQGRGKYANTLGALLVKYKGVEVPVSGMTDEQRHAWWKYPKRVIGKTVEVQYQYVTPAGSLRHPRFKRMRPDKD